MRTNTTCLNVWTQELVDDCDREFLIAGIAEGFHIVDCSDMPRTMTRSNYNSTAGVSKLKVEARIKEEIVKGNYVLCA